MSRMWDRFSFPVLGLTFLALGGLFLVPVLKPVLPLIALPYFLMMASDLRYCGYKRLDVLRIYGFNLILLPVNLSGSSLAGTRCR